MTRLLLILSLFTLCSYSYDTNYERIKGFHSEVNIQPDGSVLVTENIHVLVKGVTIKKGIYRDLPLNFELPEGRIRQVLDVKSVKRNGVQEPFHTDYIKGGIRIYIGSKSVKVPHGEQHYQIIYSLDRTVYKNGDVAEVQWNVNGNQWELMIDTLSAVVKTPNNASIQEFNGWAGRYGDSYGQEFLTKPLGEGKRVFMTDKLNPGYNLTIGVAFDRDALEEPSFFTKMSYTFRDYSLVFLGCVGFVLTLLVNLVLWFKFGRDPKKGTIIPRFYPPEGWSPAEVSFLLNEGKEDDNFFASQLIQLAVKGHIKIEKKDSKSGEDIFVISPVDESLKKEKLTDLEEGFLSKLLGTKAYIIIREKFNPSVQRANSYLLKKIEKKQGGIYFRKNKKLILPQYGIPVATLIAMGFAYNLFEGRGWMMILVGVLMIVMNVIFMKLFYQPTIKGRKMLDHILGLKRYIRYADELRINATNKPDMNFDLFEKNLPYAIAFDMSDEWGEKFKAEDIEAQYRSSNYYVRGYAFHHLAYIGALSAVTASASVPPSSAGSAGGGFSGGGFSGGGAGGGGGGGW